MTPYDKAGRLTLAKERPRAEKCTTRSYSYDADSNRTALVAKGPGEGGVCGTSTQYTQLYEYDAGGRITSLPGKYAGGETLKTSFYILGISGLAGSKTASKARAFS